MAYNSAAITAIFLLFAVNLKTCSTLSILCSYSIMPYEIITVYNCRGTVDMTDGVADTVTSVSGIHLTGKNNTHVDGLELIAQRLEYFPKNIDLFFPNLARIDVKSNEISKIINDQLRPHKQLDILIFSDNRVTSLDSNIFDRIWKLSVVIFSFNELMHVGSDINLPYHGAFFKKNPCIDSYGTTPSEIELLTKTIREKCPPLMLMPIPNVMLSGDNSTTNSVKANTELETKIKELEHQLAATKRPTKRPLTTARPCLIPNDLPSSVNVFRAADTDRELPKGSYVSAFTNVFYECKSKYMLEGHTTNFCLDGQWSLTHPVCRKYCSALSAVTTHASCEIFGETISCQQLHRPNTVARISCAEGYQKPDRIVNDLIRCDDDGEWDNRPFKCRQICGVEDPEVVPYVVGGDKVNITKVPWHIGIFSDISSKTTFTQICGGTIINAKLVISAAHCFWDTSESRFYEPSNFKVGAGKYYRDFNAVESLTPQIINVAQIITKEEYKHFAGHYKHDIALLILVHHFEFNSFIRPICLETNLDFNGKFVEPDMLGKVAGWGLVESGGESSSELKYIELPTIKHSECNQKFSVQTITEDKFCAGFTTGHSVCKGDSGGGLVFPKIVGGRTLYFLKGIVSVGGNKGNSCDNDKYSLFTNVLFHTEMVQAYDILTRPK